MSFTPSQRASLIYMALHNGISYEDDFDRTMLALKRRGLVEWRRRGKYGKSHWGLLDAGLEQAKKWMTP